MNMILALSVLFTSSCATIFVRSDSTSKPVNVYPATRFDAEFMWESGVKGEPLLAIPNPNVKNGPVTRLAYIIGGILDLPVSLLSDTIMIPFDLLAVPDKQNRTGEQVSVGNL